MPGLVTMKPVLKPRGNCSKAMARAMEERGLGALLSQARVSPAKKGRRSSTDLQALGAIGRSNLAMRLRMKLLGEGIDDDAGPDEDVRSEHEPSSVRLAAMVDDFIEDASTDRKRGRSRFDGAHGEEEPQSSLIEELVTVLHSSTESMPENVLLSEATNAVAALHTDSYIGDNTTHYLRRHVTRHLRRASFDAGICKSRWDHLGGFPGGGYEYIDVICKDPAGRIVIDVDFKAQFEVARPTAHYGALVQALPSIFVGRADQLQSVVDFMSEAVKLSLKKRGMHLAPWRKPEYMRAKWFSSYRRTTNWDNVTDGTSSSSSEDSDVSGSPDANAQSRGMDMAPQKPEEKPVVKEACNGNRIITGKGVAAMASNSFSNNDWRLPILEARKSQGPGHAGLASLFRKPVAAVQ